MHTRHTIALTVCSIFSILVAIFAIPPTARAFNPPLDTAGPLTVKIEGPALVSETEKPLPVRVVLTNKGQKPLSGKLRLQVVDSWRLDPQTETDFNVPAGGQISKDFTVTAGRGTYSAHYPIHAYANFTHNGQDLTAHPILILETKLPQKPDSFQACQWKPFDMSDRRELALWLLPTRRVVVASDGRRPLVMPTGWQGTEPNSNASLQIQPVAIGTDSREVMFLHPPWSQGHVGRVLCEFPLLLPKTDEPIHLRFACAMHPRAEKSDGVTFRVRVAAFEAKAGESGKVIFERHIKATAWDDFDVDLTPFAGQAIRLQIESDPGPKRDTGWDHSLWAEPMLLVGNPKKPQDSSPDKIATIHLGTLKSEEGPYQVRLRPGRHGLLDTLVSFENGKQELSFRGFDMRVQSEQLGREAAPTALVNVATKHSGNQYETRHKFRNFFGETFTLVGRLSIENGVLQAKFRLEDTPSDRPWRVFYIEDVAAGPWNRKADKIYAGHGNVICNPRRFDLGFDGHRLATSFVGFDFENNFSMLQAVDLPCNGLTVRPQDRHYSLHAAHETTISFIPRDNVWKGVKKWRAINGLKASAGVEKLAGRFVFDLWGGHYKSSADQLSSAFRYGLTDAAVVWHNWQRWGYDYRLPNICPPNPHLGTLQQMRELSDTCRDAGVLFVPHDNYIDLYPDADGFSYEKHIVFHNADRPMRAWINKGRDAQSYRYRPESIAAFLQPNVKWIKQNLAPTGYFIDVWSSAPPYDYWTSDGRFGTRIFTRDTWARHFAWIREHLGDNAPQISESGHDQLIGFLDGAQTNHLRVGKPIPEKQAWTVWNIDCDDAERIPWFDAAHHDRFINHGAGYSSRYEGGLDPRLHGIYSDDYIATEVLTGHPVMVPYPFSRDVVRKYWLLADLMRALALRTIEKVEFVGGDIHRQHISWSGGADVWVNRGKSDWKVAARVLPEFGFFANVPTENGKAEASIERRDGVIVESARSPGRIFINGRQVVSGIRPIRPIAKKFESLGGREFRVHLDWLADEPVPDDLMPFVHFVDADGNIVFQTGHNPPKFDPTSTGTLHATTHGAVPENLRPGSELELRVGLYRPGHGERHNIDGSVDNEARIRLGMLRLEGQGEKVTRIAWTPRASKRHPTLDRQNSLGKAIDFDGITTVGGCRILSEKDSIRLIPLPQGRKFTVKIHSTSTIGPTERWKFIETLDEDGKRLKRQEVNREGNEIVIECAPNTFGYRLTEE
ncbi:MAG: hypothetical protein JXM70_27965 [Pirellulales bacterium]|nr:hypothetical protein [Pirellulales bacterium]